MKSKFVDSPFTIRKWLRTPTAVVQARQQALIGQGPQGLGRLIELGWCDFILKWQAARSA